MAHPLCSAASVAAAAAAAAAVVGAGVGVMEEEVVVGRAAGEAAVGPADLLTSAALCRRGHSAAQLSYWELLELVDGSLPGTGSCSIRGPLDKLQSR